MNDYEVVVRGLAQMLQPYRDRVRVLELDVNVSPSKAVDVTLYDTFSVSQADGDSVAALVAHSLSGRVVVFSWDTRPDLVRAGLAAGVSGYLAKTLTAEQLVGALERVHAGERVVISADASWGDDLDPEQAEQFASKSWPGHEAGLTLRESEVLALITQGLSNRDIAARTHLSMNTVKTYIRTAYRRIDVDSRSRAVRWGLTHGMDADRARVLAEGTRP
ncbi:MAG: response regulator transcription factor [Ornithinimicrobium sp.]